MHIENGDGGDDADDDTSLTHHCLYLLLSEILLEPVPASLTPLGPHHSQSIYAQRINEDRYKRSRGFKMLIGKCALHRCALTATQCSQIASELTQTL